MMYDYADSKRAQNNKVKNKPSPSRPVQRKTGDHSDTELKPDPLIPLQAKIDFSQVSQPVQRREGFGAIESNHHVVAPPKVNKTGLPDRLKTNIERLSGGIDISDVKVHRNSSAPEKIGALAYAKGTDIHLGPGQEKHLPHEAWHVVQQKQGRVPENTQFKGLAGNDNVHLEKEADVMGAAAVRQTQPAMNSSLGKLLPINSVTPRHSHSIVQAAIEDNPGYDRFKSGHQQSKYYFDLWINASILRYSNRPGQKVGLIKAKWLMFKTRWKKWGKNAKKNFNGVAIDRQAINSQDIKSFESGNYLDALEGNIGRHIIEKGRQLPLISWKERMILRNRLWWHDKTEEDCPLLWKMARGQRVRIWRDVNEEELVSREEELVSWEDEL